MATSLDTGLSIPLAAPVKAIPLKPANTTYGSIVSSRRRPLNKNTTKSHNVEIVDLGNDEAKSNLKKKRLDDLPPLSSKVIALEMAIVSEIRAVELMGTEMSFRKLVVSSGSLKSSVETEVFKITHMLKGIALAWCRGLFFAYF
ncbi:hypothetical protein GIB67_041622 [Kingdonia uniflora]|uniref:Uncharacterized protein n=1 Tax=Kingdonia uniflora TaxID=39325 RepID=A0A7J7MQJ9_9MAGN|nr:hypothetical protein GIB67_041622 [Kingdonia uniflora]